MKRTTVKIPDDLDLLLRREAERRGATVSELTREALEILLRPGGKRKFLAAKAGRSGHTDISERVEAILREEAARSQSS